MKSFWLAKSDETRLGWIVRLLLFGVVVCYFCSRCEANDCYIAQRQVAYYYAQPVAAYAAPLVYYSAGERLITDANVEKIAAAIIRQQQQQAQVQAPVKSQVQAPQPQPQIQPRQNIARVPASILAIKCAECHSGTKPKKGIVIDGKTEMFCNQVTASIRAIRDDHMPLNGPPLSNAEKAQALEELLALESRLPPGTPQNDGGEPVEPMQGNDLPPPRPQPRPRDDGNLQ